MKRMKKFMSLALALIMVLAMTTTAFAAGPYSITINNGDEGYVYEAYQIFDGDLSGTTLSNIVWGSGVTEAGKTALGNADERAEALKTTADAEAFAKEVAKYLGTAAGTATAPNDGKYVISGLEAGYYLVRNTSVPTVDGAYTSYILQVVGDVTMEPKSDKPSVDKEVKDEPADAENGAADGWGETADHDLGETFQFKLTATIPNNPDMDAYKTYKLVFHDTMSDGVTFEKIASVKVTTSEGKEIDVTEYVCTAKAGQEGGSWTLTIEDLKQVVSDIKGATVTVIYDAHLNGNAVVGNNDGNQNTVYLEYSNNPNSDGTGKTPEDIVYVFTFELKNNKVDEDGGALAGAGFKLKNSEDKWYKKNADGTVSWVDKEEDGTEVTSDADGKFNFVGLDAGTYTLVETTTPPGYNTCKDIEVVITAVHNEKEDTTSATVVIKINGEDVEGVKVTNNKGAELPETGGMGTTMFYIIGSLLVIGAGVLLVTKKRMGSESK